MSCLRPLLTAVGGVLAALGGVRAEAPFTVAPVPWPLQGQGNHRAVVRIATRAEAVGIELPWRRRDNDPRAKGLIVVDAATGQTLRDVLPVDLTRDRGRLLVRPATVPGVYHVYYLPYRPSEQWGNFPYDYTAPAATADPGWAARWAGAWEQAPRAVVERFEARTPFDSRDPMEVRATGDEVAALYARQPERSYLVFAEDRQFPIRMTEDIPLRWVVSGPVTTFAGTAYRNEYYAFQLGVWAMKERLREVTVTGSELRGPAGVLPAAAVRCFNTSGTDTDGRPFTRTVAIPHGRVQALWIGVDVGPETAPGAYTGTVTVQPAGAAPTAVAVTLTVRSERLDDRGDSEPWRHGRLRWLDSTLGADDSVTRPYTSLAVSNRCISSLSSRVTLGDHGLPAAIACAGVDVLAGPISLAVDGVAGPLLAAPASNAVGSVTGCAGRVTWTSRGEGGGLAWRCAGTMEFDGHQTYLVRLQAQAAVAITNIALTLPLRAAAATHLMGIGRAGGRRPPTHTWRWQGPYDSFWVGDVAAGLHVELRGGTYHGPLLNLYNPDPPAAWFNRGRGGCTIATRSPEVVEARVFTGARALAAGEELTLAFALLPTPVKPLDWPTHFRTRYWHADNLDESALAAGVNVVNLHHATTLNPYINYPFLTVDKLRGFVDSCHARGVACKLYYTLRELSNHTTELWALRSLGHEALAGGRGGGFPWLREHLEGDYRPQWFTPVAGGDYDAALLTSGESRYYNYYVEGVSWLARNTGMDGLYLDDVSFDRRLLKRVRRVLDGARPAALIDLHSNTAFSVGPANQYAEFLPYVDRLWFGESFAYEELRPDEWLVQVSGAPFGVMGEMLQGGGNAWRGAVYGITARLSQSPSPRAVWRIWDEFGIGESRVLGYWAPDCPVQTGHADVPATAFVRLHRTLIALASWAPGPVNVQLAVDWRALGMAPERAVLRAPAAEGFQPAAEFRPGAAIPVAPGKGWLLIVEEVPR